MNNSHNESVNSDHNLKDADDIMVLFLMMHYKKQIQPQQKRLRKIMIRIMSLRATNSTIVH